MIELLLAIAASVYVVAGVAVFVWNQKLVRRFHRAFDSLAPWLAPHKQSVGDVVWCVLAGLFWPVSIGLSFIMFSEEIKDAKIHRQAKTR